MVVMRGAAIMAGSALKNLAAMGSTPPTVLASSTVTNRAAATVSPEDATDKSLLWTSDSESITVEDGVVTVSSTATAGEYTITVTSVSNTTVKTTCTVTVQAKDFSIDPTSKTLYVGESFTIGYKVKPPVSPVFESQSPGIATVDQSGKVTAVAGGEAKIKVSAHGIDLYCTVTVVNPQIGFPSSGRVMYNGETVTIPYSVLVPSDAPHTG